MRNSNPLILLALCAASFSTLAACGGDSSDADGSGDAGGGTDDSGGDFDWGGSDSGGDFDWGGGGEPATCPEVPPLQGSASVSYTTFDGRAYTAEYPSVTCETLHGADGSVTGWLATFGEFDADAIRYGNFNQVPHFTILLGGLYAGEGVYDQLAFGMTLDDGAGFSTSTLTGNPNPASGPVLTLTDGGRAGTLSIGDPTRTNDDQVEISFTCDPASPTSLDAPEPFVLSPGTASAIEPSTGSLLRFTNVYCPNTSSFYARSPDYSAPVCDWSVFYLSAGLNNVVSGPVTYPIEGGSYIFYKGLSVVWAGFSEANQMTIESVGPVVANYNVQLGFEGSIQGQFSCDQQGF